MLTLSSFCISLVSFITADVTKSDVAWAVGVAAGCVAIISGILTIREKHLSIKKLKQEIHAKKQNR